MGRARDYGQVVMVLVLWGFSVPVVVLHASEFDTMNWCAFAFLVVLGLGVLSGAVKRSIERRQSR